MPDGILIAVLIIGLPWLGVLFFGAPFVPTRSRDIEQLFKYVDKKATWAFLDLGSGDGRLLIKAVEHGAIRAVGLELNPLLVYISRFKARQRGLEKQIEVLNRNFWNYDISNFDVVFIFGIEKIMPKLEEKIKKELRPRAILISYGFRLPNLEPKITDKPFFIYTKG